MKESWYKEIKINTAAKMLTNTLIGLVGWNFLRGAKIGFSSFETGRIYKDISGRKCSRKAAIELLALSTITNAYF